MNIWRTAVLAIGLALVLVGCSGAAGSSKYAGVYEMKPFGVVAVRITLNADGTCKTEVPAAGTTANCKYVVDGQTITLASDTGTAKATFDSNGCMTTTTGDKLCKAGSTGGGSTGGPPIGVFTAISARGNITRILVLNADGTGTFTLSDGTKSNPPATISWKWDAATKTLVLSAPGTNSSTLTQDAQGCLVIAARSANEEDQIYCPAS